MANYFLQWFQWRVCPFSFKHFLFIILNHLTINLLMLLNFWTIKQLIF